MNRTDAIDLLAKTGLTRLSAQERERLLADWWSIDTSESGYAELPVDLRTTLLQGDYPEDIANPCYDPLIGLALRKSFKGVKNAYLTKQLSILGIDELVEGHEEQLFACPCCRYMSLGERGGYEICPVCFWEDDGTTDSDRISGPNHMTLDEARSNFQAFGAVSEEARRHVLIDGPDRYFRSSQEASGR